MLVTIQQVAELMRGEKSPRKRKLNLKYVAKSTVRKTRMSLMTKMVMLSSRGRIGRLNVPRQIVAIKYS